MSRASAPLLWLCAAVGLSTGLRTPLPAQMHRPAPHAARSASAPRMVLGLPVPGTLPGVGALFGGGSGPEVLYEGGQPIDFQMETLHITKRRCSGGLLISAPPEDIWSVITDYEALPEGVPNILSNVVTRNGVTGGVTIQQESLLSTRLNLVTSMSLEAVEERDAWTMTLRRLSGHGFLEFEGKYTLSPRPGGATYLSYSVELVPCPIFPLPLVERKIRKEVPKMLSAVAEASRRRSSS